jgi:hypothetical protein
VENTYGITSSPFYFEYQFTTKNDGGIEIPSQYLELNAQSGDSEDADWVTIPWNQLNLRPVDDLRPVLSPGGWTFLYGQDLELANPRPCWFTVEAEVGLKSPTPLAQAHIRLYETTSQDGGVVRGRTAHEWTIGAKETSTAHITGSWSGRLLPGRRLRCAVDYWHAPNPAMINRATISGMYWPL